MARRGGVALLALGIFIGSGAAACRIEPRLDGSLYLATNANPGEIFRVVGTPPA